MKSSVMLDDIVTVCQEQERTTVMSLILLMMLATRGQGAGTRLPPFLSLHYSMSIFVLLIYKDTAFLCLRWTIMSLCNFYCKHFSQISSSVDRHRTTSFNSETKWRRRTTVMKKLTTTSMWTTLLVFIAQHHYFTNEISFTAVSYVNIVTIIIIT